MSDVEEPVEVRPLEPRVCIKLLRRVRLELRRAGGWRLDGQGLSHACMRVVVVRNIHNTHNHPSQQEASKAKSTAGTDYGDDFEEEQGALSGTGPVPEEEQAPKVRDRQAARGAGHARCACARSCVSIPSSLRAVCVCVCVSIPPSPRAHQAEPGAPATAWFGRLSTFEQPKAAAAAASQPQPPNGKPPPAPSVAPAFARPRQASHLSDPAEWASAAAPPPPPRRGMMGGQMHACPNNSKFTFSGAPASVATRRPVTIRGDYSHTA
jgi:hypothetical protein